MAVKRTLLIDPDTGERSVRVTVDVTQPTPEDGDAIRQMLQDASTPGRLREARARLPELEGLPEYAEALSVLEHGERACAEKSWPTADAAWLEFCALYEHGKRRREILATAPKVARDDARQGGTRKPRGSRMRQLDAWLDAALRATPQATAKELWRALPTDTTKDVYCDGDRVCESKADGRERSIGYDGFEARLTAAKNRR